MSHKQDLGAIAGQFQTDGAFVRAVPYGSGHINDTYCVSFSNAGAISRFILQRINDRIFRNPAALMQNIARVTEHLAAQTSENRRALTLIPERSGLAWHVDEEGSYWRAYRFLEGTHTRDAIESPQQAFEAARAFGRFQQQLAGLPAPRLHDTIPEFHHTPKRFLALEEAIARDAVGRVRSAEPEIAFARERKALTSALLNAGLPERVIHNDTKLNNVLLDDATGEAICVIDLDTVMPGLAPYDFGDMVRTMTCPAAEDEPELAKVNLQFPLFEAVARGYLSAAGVFLTQAEREHLVLAGKLITFEQGIRFLADYLNGDTYYKVHHTGQNLARCRTQFKLVESMEEKEVEMERLLGSIG